MSFIISSPARIAPSRADLQRGSLLGLLALVGHFLATHRQARRLMVTLIGGTLAMIVVSAVAELVVDFGPASWTMPDSLRLDHDNGLPERLMQACALLASGALFAAFYQRRVTACFGLGCVYLVIFLDDTLAYHERFGTVLQQALGLQAAFGLRAQDLGELMAWGLAGGVLLIPLVRAWILDGPLDRVVLALFGLCLAGLGVVGAGFDMLGMMITTPGIGRLILIAEDGGEMFFVAVAATVAMVLVSLLRSGALDAGNAGASETP